MPQIVLVNPQIPPNTGNIARSCAATQTELHLVAPLGFEISDRYLKRAGLDYWGYVDLHIHESWQNFVTLQQSRGGRCLSFSARGKISYAQFQFQPGDWLLFGSETTGLPPEIIATSDAALYIPMKEKKVRSLNLSVSVTIGLFESLRQLGTLE